jgi:spore germination cell wall hydrolase CwlJ-like protein
LLSGLHRTRALALVAILAIVQVACVTDYRRAAGSGRITGQAAVARGFSNIALERVTADMDPAMLALARRHDPAPRKDYWGRVTGWATYDLTSLPTLGDFNFTALDAQMINALRPGSLLPPPAARPFVFKGAEEDRLRAEECLTQAIYYEAAIEPIEGMEAVAQTVLNRLRHPAYQGSQRITGCQFSFTCDGSLARVPNVILWERARGVAQKALAGFVLPSVGTATHYHADYVAPYWAPTLYKIHTIGRHIFYRWTGPWGLPPAFTGRYAGGENALSLAVLEGLDSRTQGAQLVGETLSPAIAAARTLTLEVDGVERTYTVRDLVALPTGPEPPRVDGVLAPTRRLPTAQEVSDINARLKAMEDPDAPMPTAPATTPVDSGDLPIATRRY